MVRALGGFFRQVCVFSSETSHSVCEALLCTHVRLQLRVWWQRMAARRTSIVRGIGMPTCLACHKNRSLMHTRLSCLSAHTPGITHAPLCYCTIFITIITITPPTLQSPSSPSHTHTIDRAPSHPGPRLPLVRRRSHHCHHRRHVRANITAMHDSQHTSPPQYTSPPAQTPFDRSDKEPTQCCMSR